MFQAHCLIERSSATTRSEGRAVMNADTVSFKPTASRHRNPMKRISLHDPSEATAWPNSCLHQRTAHVHMHMQTVTQRTQDNSSQDQRVPIPSTARAFRIWMDPTPVHPFHVDPPLVAACSMARPASPSTKQGCSAQPWHGQPHQFEPRSLIMHFGLSDGSEDHLHVDQGGYKQDPITRPALPRNPRDSGNPPLRPACLAILPRVAGSPTPHHGRPVGHPGNEWQPAGPAMSYPSPKGRIVGATVH